MKLREIEVVVVSRKTKGFGRHGSEVLYDHGWVAGYWSQITLRSLFLGGCSGTNTALTEGKRVTRDRCVYSFKTTA